MTEIVVTGEALGAARRAFAEACRSYDRASDGTGEPSPMHAALEAAAPHLQVQVDRQTLALLLADTVQTLDKDEEWVIADRVIALLRSSGEGGK